MGTVSNMKRLVTCAVLSVAALPAVALAAAKPGTYSGVSSAKYVQVGSATEPTDKGKVTFTVKSSKALNFKMTGQQMNCGPGPIVNVSVRTIRLNSAGKGSATYKDPNVGTLKVTIAVTSTGKASGTIRRPPAAVGLCNPDYPARFTAKRR
jgi:hypothetical protein